MTDRYSAATARRVSGLSYRRLDYLCRPPPQGAGLFTPDVPAEGTGNRRGFSFADLLALRCIGALRAAGVPLQGVRKVAAKLRAYGRDLGDTVLLVRGAGRRCEVLMLDPPRLVALLREPGQVAAAAVVLPLGRVAREVREAVARERHAA